MSTIKSPNKKVYKQIIMYRYIIKNVLDFAFSLLSIIILSPLFIVIWTLLLIIQGNPVLFCQLRPGKAEVLFNIYKFRTMTNRKDRNGNLLPDSERMTRFGLFLRKTSLDELPQLFNIFRQINFLHTRIFF